MKVGIRAKINLGGKDWVAHVTGLTGDQIQQMGQDIAAEAERNVGAMSFIESTGELKSNIDYQKTGALSCQVSAAADHSSYIEWGTKYIDQKMPFIWPAYRKVKKALLSGKPWV
jgi:HK97 gp10 family phage protein